MITVQVTYEVIVDDAPENEKGIKTTMEAKFLEEEQTSPILLADKLAVLGHDIQNLAFPVLVGARSISVTTE